MAVAGVPAPGAPAPAPAPGAPPAAPPAPPGAPIPGGPPPGPPPAPTPAHTTRRERLANRRNLIILIIAGIAGALFGWWSSNRPAWQSAGGFALMAVGVAILVMVIMDEFHERQAAPAPAPGAPPAAPPAPAPAAPVAPPNPTTPGIAAHHTDPAGVQWWWDGTTRWWRWDGTNWV